MARNTNLSSQGSGSALHGSLFRCFPDSLYFWRLTRNNHLSSATKKYEIKDLCEVLNYYFALVNISSWEAARRKKAAWTSLLED